MPDLIRWLPFPRSVKRYLWDRRSRRDYQRRIDLAKSAGDSKQVRDLRDERQNEEHMDYEDREVAATRKLLKTAYQLRVHVPAVHEHRNGSWEVTDDWSMSWQGEKYLTQAGFRAVLEEVRKEKRARAELRQYWVTWIAAVTGIIGALTGFFAVLGKR